MHDEEEDVNSYWLTVRKRQDTGNRKRKHQITPCGEFGFEESVVLS